MLDGNISSKSDNTGIITDYTYNNAGMLASESISNALEQLQSMQYTYDNRGNRTESIGTGYDEYSETYTYDLNNRLTNVGKVVYNEYDHPDNIFSTRYNYDFNGNLFSENVSAIAKTLDNSAIGLSDTWGRDTWGRTFSVTLGDVHFLSSFCCIN